LIFRIINIITISLTLLIILTSCTVAETITVTLQNSPELTQDSSLIGQGNHYTVVIESFAFVPSELHIKPGDTIIWVNEDTKTHGVTPWYHDQDEDDTTHTWIGEVWGSGDIEPRSSFSRTFNQSGTYGYVSLPLHVITPIIHYLEFNLGAIGIIMVAE